ncbi:hypothetical protein FF011L_07370 [Roseimaritima multifibrata]|uniref:Uncharacterized protein n=2 Tax=Roseimaritima multifibrata TaxID=1930274 RepID=A0A517MAX2_9BACT|nr:hypothetical protein FF011L_07370 [Roseimaritima multifibrata]
MLLGLSGCVSWEFTGRRAAWRVETRAMADTAFQNQFGANAKQTGCTEDYRAGWLDGYTDVLRGGSGQPPVVPDSRYWGPGVRHAENTHRVGEWHQGFIDGAEAALVCGQQGYATVPGSMPAQPHPAPQAIYTASCHADLAPDGMVNNSPSPLPPLPTPLPPTLESLDIAPPIEGYAEPVPTEILPTPSAENSIPYSNEIAPPGSPIPFSPAPPSEQFPGDILESDLDLVPESDPLLDQESGSDDDDLLLGSRVPMNAAFGRLQAAKQTMQMASPTNHVANYQHSAPPMAVQTPPIRQAAQQPNRLPPVTSPWTLR